MVGGKLNFFLVSYKSGGYNLVIPSGFVISLSEKFVSISAHVLFVWIGFRTNGDNYGYDSSG